MTKRSGKSRQDMTPEEKRRHNQKRRARAQARQAGRQPQSQQQRKQKSTTGVDRRTAGRPAEDVREAIHLPDVHMTNETAPDPVAVAHTVARFREDLGRGAGLYREGLEHVVFVAWVAADGRAPATTVDLAGVEERLPLFGVALLTVGFTGRRRGRDGGRQEVLSALTPIRWAPAGGPGVYRLVADRPVARSFLAGDQTPTFAPAEAGWATAALWGVAQLLTLAGEAAPGDEVAPAAPEPVRFVYGGHTLDNQPTDLVAVPMTGAEYDPATGLFQLAPGDADPTRTYLNFGVPTARDLAVDARYDPPLPIRQTAGWGLLGGHVRAVWRQVGPVTLHTVVG